MSDLRRARLATLGCLVAAGIVLAACGGSSNKATPAAAVSTTTTVAGGGGRGAGFGAGLTAFRTCMTSHGVTLPQTPAGGGNRTPPSTTPGETRPARPAGGFGGGGNLADRFKTPPAGVDPTKYKAALAACVSKLPTFPAGGGAAANSSAFKAYSSCLSDHGVTIPATGGFGSINRSDPKVQAAMKTCAPLLPAGGFGRTTTTTAPSA